MKSRSRHDVKFKSARHGYGLHSFHPLSSSKNKGVQKPRQDTLFPTEKPILFSYGYLVCDECLDRDGYQSYHRNIQRIDVTINHVNNTIRIFIRSW